MDRLKIHWSKSESREAILKNQRENWNQNLEVRMILLPISKVASLH